MTSIILNPCMCSRCRRVGRRRTFSGTTPFNAIELAAMNKTGSIAAADIAASTWSDAWKELAVRLRLDPLTEILVKHEIWTEAARAKYLARSWGKRLSMWTGGEIEAQAQAAIDAATTPSLPKILPEVLPYIAGGVLLLLVLRKL